MFKFKRSIETRLDSIRNQLYALMMFLIAKENHAIGAISDESYKECLDTMSAKLTDILNTEEDPNA